MAYALEALIVAKVVAEVCFSGLAWNALLGYKYYMYYLLDFDRLNWQH